MPTSDLEHRFTHHPPKAEQVGLYKEMRKRALELARYADGAVPDSREKALALTKLEEFVMHINAGIARHT